MKRYILTGTPGSGKTSLLHELKSQGYMERIERENVYQRQVFFLEHPGFCQSTEARKISFEETLLFEKIHAEIYTSLGYHLIKVPPEALSQRVHRIMKWIMKSAM